MKKLLISLGLIISALTLTNCTKNVEEPNAAESQKTNFSIFADFELTKTEASTAGKTSWTLNDEINVFFGNGSYENCGKFVCKDVKTGRFEGTLSEAQLAKIAENETNDWYFVYPYSSYRINPNETSSGAYNEVGCKKGTPLTQASVNDKSHLDGKNLPLYAVCKDVANDASPAPVMKQIASVLEIQVSNTDENEITVSKIEFSTTNHNVSGTYYFDIVSNPIVLTGSGKDYVSKTASLNVTSGTIAAGSSANFYLPITPFTVGASPEAVTLSVTVNGTKVTKNANVPANTAFASGHIKPLRFSYAVPAVERVSEGDYVILAYKTDKSVYYALSSTANSSRLNSVDYPYSGEETLSPTDETLVWHISDKGSNYKISGNTGYYLAWSSENSAKTQEDEYELTITKDGETYQIASSATPARIIARNTSNSYFAFYEGTQYNNLLFIPVVPDTRTPLDAVTNLMADKVEETPNSIDVSWNTVTGAANYTVSISPADAEPQIVSGTECTFSGLKYSTEYTISIVANPTDAETNKPSDAVTTTATTGASLSPQLEISIDFTNNEATKTVFSPALPNAKDQDEGASTFTYNTVEYSVLACANTYMNSDGYLMVRNGSAFGLPAVTDKRLTKVVVYNSSGCSTSVTIGISSTKPSTSTLITGGASQTFSKTGSSYTYNVSGTANNTMYYLYNTSTSKNAQVTKIVLTYE